MSYSTTWPVLSNTPIPPLPTREQFVAEALGNFCGIRLANYGLPNDTLFDPAVLCSPDDDLRDAGIGAHCSRGHNTIVVQPAFDYTGFTPYDYWDDLPAFRRLLISLRQCGLRLVLFCSQDQDDAAVRFANGDVNRLAAATEGLISAVCAGWEFEPSCDPQAWLNWSQQLRLLFPDAYRVTHWTPERVGPEALPGKWTWEGGFWQYCRAHDLVEALFYQTLHGSNILIGDDWQARVVECVERIQEGEHGWGGEWLSDVWFFESIAYDFTRSKAVPEQRGIQVASQARALGCASSLNM